MARSGVKDHNIEERLAIRATNLIRTYPGPGGVGSVGVGIREGLSFEVNKQELFGVIGPDGAGKTTLFRLLTSLLTPEEGEAIVAGCDTVTEYKKLRNRIGYMPGTFSLYPDLTVTENLHFFATLFNTTVHENYELIKDIYEHIAPFKTRKAKDLSGGMKQKLALSCALIHRPQIIFLDEPTTGVDPISRVELWEMLRKLTTMGVTVFVSTAYMDEAKRCDRVAFMLDGAFIATRTPEEYEQTYPYPLLSVKGGDRIEMLTKLRDFKGSITSYAFGETMHVSVEEGVTIEMMRDYLRQEQVHGLESVEIAPISPTIEDSFIALSRES